MNSVEEIWNYALVLAGVTGSYVASTDEDSVASRAFLQCYDTVRRQVLVRLEWSFATRETPLTLLADREVANWEYVYAYPTDCLFDRFIPDGSGKRPKRQSDLVPYQVAASANGQGEIWTNQAEACLEYTYDAYNVVHFPEDFIEVLAWMLGARVTIALSGTLDPFTMVQMANQTLATARAVDANRGQVDPVVMSDWEKARGGTTRWNES